MKDRIQQLEKDFEVAKESLQRMRDRLNDLKDSEEEFEEGGWAVPTENLLGFRGGVPVRLIERDKGDNGWLVEQYGSESMSGKTPYVWYHEDSLRPATEDEIKEALIAEAKRRGFTEDYDGAIIDTAGGEYYAWVKHEEKYVSATDTLWMPCGDVYRKGQWAEKIEDTVTINGVECEALKGHIKLSFGDYFPIQKFRHFLELVGDYDLTVHRQGEDITPQLKKLGEQI